ncbi:hypothetical protein HMI55_004482, partial [Coelomomyces lativittatus]
MSFTPSTPQKQVYISSRSESSSTTKSYPSSPSSQLTFKSTHSTYRRSSTSICYELNQPLTRRLTPLFQKYRKDVLERIHLESVRLQTRLKKFLMLYSDPNYQQGYPK